MCLNCVRNTLLILQRFKHDSQSSFGNDARTPVSGIDPDAKNALVARAMSLVSSRRRLTMLHHRPAAVSCRGYSLTSAISVTQCKKLKARADVPRADRVGPRRNPGPYLFCAMQHDERLCFGESEHQGFRIRNRIDGSGLMSSAVILG
jgi:hypothetical protein